jgi:flagellar basal body rod protein FlgC
MANHTTGRSKKQRPTLYRGGTVVFRPKDKQQPASNQDVDGVDRRRIDSLAEDRRDNDLLRQVWDE